MCGRLLVGKSKRRVALLVGAAMYALEGVLVGARSSSRVMMALRRELLGGKKVADWLLNLPVSWMALIVFVATYLIAGGVCSRTLPWLDPATTIMNVWFRSLDGWPCRR